MSRIGKQPITIPDKVKVDVKGQKVFVEGPTGAPRVPARVPEASGSLPSDLPNATSPRRSNSPSGWSAPTTTKAAQLGESTAQH